MKRYRVRPGSIAEKVIKNRAKIAAVLLVGAIAVCVTAYKPEPLQVEVYAEESHVVYVDEVAGYQHYNIPLSYEMQDYITERCLEKKIAPTLIFAMIEVESRYQVNAIGDAGRSEGLMQIQKRWHKADMEAVGANNLLNPYENVDTGTYIVADLLSKGKGTTWALTAYNAGVKKANSNLKANITSNYAKRVYEAQASLEEV